MKKIILILLFLSFKNIQAQYVTIPDTVFRAYLDTAFPGCMMNHMLDTTCSGILNATAVIFRIKALHTTEGIQYFKNLQTFEVSDNGVLPLTITSVPPTVTSFICNGDRLRTLPVLPAGLKHFDCSLNFLTKLPKLPDSLVTLSCMENEFTSLPDLPKTLQELYAQLNFLSSLPKLPDSLWYIRVDQNYLTALPPLPKYLGLLEVNQNRLTTLPSLPSTLLYLDVKDNPLTCLPLLPYNINGLYTLRTNITCQPNFVNPNVQRDTILPHCPNISYACPANPYIQGRIYLDENNNGVFDSMEKLLPAYLVHVSPSGWLGVGDSSGYYLVKLDTMVTNTWTCSARKYATVTPALYSLNPGNYLGLMNGSYDFGIWFPPGIYDLQAQLSSSPARPGFITTVTAGILNVGTVSQDNVTVKMKVPAGFSPLLPPSSISGDTLIWDGLHIDSLNEGSITVQFVVPASDPLGTPLTYEMWVIGNPADSTPADNYSTWTEKVVGSFDPNDKSVNLSSLPPNYDADKDRLIYTIRFQNTGTLAADFVMVRDIIPSNLDISSLQVVNASHPYQLHVRDKNIVEVVFPNIQLSDSFTSETFSHGFVQLSFKPKAGLPVNTQIDNNALIYFDYNAPVVTNTATTKVQIMVGIANNKKLDFKLYPNPSSGIIKIELPAAANGKWVLSDMSGRTLLQSTIPQNENIFDISVANIPAGTYLLSIEINGNISTSKIVITR